MTHKKHPEGTTEVTHTRNQDKRLQIFSDADRIASFEYKVQMAFLEEAARVGRFDEYRRIAAERMDLAKQAKAYADKTVPVIRKLLIDLPFPKIVLQVEDLIDKTRPAIRVAIDMLMSSADKDGHFKYGDASLNAATLSSELAHSKLAGILREYGTQRGIASEKTMALNPVTNRDRRVARDTDLPAKIRQKAVPELADDLRKSLQQFAAGNAFITLNDIDELMATLEGSKLFFREEMETWRGISATVKTMRAEGRPPEEVREILLSHNMSDRFRTFNEKILDLEVALRIAALRMEFVNQPVNEVLTKEYDIGTIQQLLRRQIELSKDKEAGKIRQIMERVFGKKPGDTISKRENVIFAKVLAGALNNISKRKF